MHSGGDINPRIAIGCVAKQKLNFDYGFEIHADVSSGSPSAEPPVKGRMGAVSSQVIKDVSYPVGIFSRALTNKDQSYPSVILEKQLYSHV